MNTTPTKATQRRILVVGNAADVVALATPLQGQGFSVQLCSDGPQALESALRYAPGLMLVDTGLVGVSPDRLSHILRSTPRLKDLPFLFIGKDGDRVDGFQRHRDLFLARPFNPEQLIHEISTSFARRERARQVGLQEKQIEGNLSQIALTDLLQIFALNRKSGMLSLARRSEQGALYLNDGMVVNARLGRVEGEKAVYRLLLWQEGKFWFFPGQPEVENRIAVQTDHLIMEGLRQNDEMAALAATFPPLDVQLTLKIPRERLPQGLRPITQEVLQKLEYFPGVAELLDQCSAPDYELLQILKTLIDKGVVEERRTEDVKAQQRQVLLTTTQIIAARERLGDHDTLMEQGTAKLLLLASNPEQLRRFVQALQGVHEFAPDAAFLSGVQELALGDLGLLTLSETFALRLFCLPAAPPMAPLWPVFLRRSFGIVLLAPNGALPEFEAFLATRPGDPFVYAGNDPSAANTLVLPRGDRSALRNL
ncbi:MAG: hypothetical protein A2091_01445, partial [Desulfuromonadales bacterium GWD2_61_12]